MPYRTRLTLSSGDRRLLDDTVDRVCDVANRKGANLGGPHTKPTKTISVPLFRSTTAVDPIDTWEYTIYTRELVITGHDGVARSISQLSIPPGVAIDLRIESTEPVES